MTAVQRTEVVLQLLRREDAGKCLARQCGFSEQTLYRWWDEFIRAGESGDFDRKCCGFDYVANRCISPVEGAQLPTIHNLIFCS